ncbi:MAG: hypothetical protein NZ929_04385 [Aigarchaeota archaeon]|nr:hypothetical protein [Aigarchaeota archaeon]MCX8192724.1 hypothetical protein [Nitrososphaeria archaeon]MDW7985976.1 hypothetical protein [Nitrososphaerota archaeon]
MILETHGDTCRLGYLRIIPCIMEDEEPRSFDFISSILYDIIKNAEDLRTIGRNAVGLITRPVNARNYVTLAVEMGMIDRKMQKLGVFGKIYLVLNSSDLIREFVEGRSQLSMRDLINLSDSERLYFMWVVAVSDYPFIQLIINWAVEKERFTRQEAMNYIMEEAYPASLKKILNTLPESKRKNIELEIVEAEKFRDKRTSIIDKTDWIRTSLYSKYRHIAPPRLEWLVDVGILRRDGRGKYSVDEQVVRNIEKFSKIPKMSLHKFEEYIFEEVSKMMFGSFRSAGRYEISKTILEAYSRLEKHGLGQIRLDYLEKVTSLLLIEKRLYASLSSIHDVFNSLAIRFPDKIYVAPSPGGSLNVARIDLTESEI